MAEKTLAVSRFELKYLINFAQYSRIAHTIGSALTEDKHNGSMGYLVRSLYFDSYANTDFYEKLDGVENRKKVRLRIYSHDAPYVNLELKKKIGNSQEKSTVIISREDASDLINCNYDVLTKYESSTASVIYNIMKVNHLRPVVLIEYRRKAFIHPMNNIRITLDSEIRSSETDFNLLKKDLILNPVEDYYTSIVEIKYNGFIYKWITDLVQSNEITLESYSKYSNARMLFEQYIA